ncbi:MAG TPA: glycosyltransferase family 9 protein, partial [Rhodanobacteraceae bacterium]
MTRISHFLDPRLYSEWRRRIVRGTLGPLRRIGDARLQQSVSVVDVHRVLICRPNHRLGNLLLLTPLVQELEQRLPNATIDLAAAGDIAPELFAGFQNVGRVYCLAHRIVRHLAATIRTLTEIRHAHYDWTIDPCLGSESGRFLALSAGAWGVLGFPRRSLVSAWDELDPLHGLPPHAAQMPVYLLRRALGCDYEHLRAPYPPLALRLSAVERAAGRQALSDRLRRAAKPPAARTIVGVFADATGAKRFPQAWWRRFIAALNLQRPDDAFVEVLPPDGRSPLAMDLPNFCSPSPRSVAAVVSGMTCFVSADCGVMHLACASGTPTIGLFSASDVAKYGP